MLDSVLEIHFHLGYTTIITASFIAAQTLHHKCHISNVMPNMMGPSDFQNFLTLQWLYHESGLGLHDGCSYKVYGSRSCIQDKLLLSNVKPFGYSHQFKLSMVGVQRTVTLKLVNNQRA